MRFNRDTIILTLSWSPTSPDLINPVVLLKIECTKTVQVANYSWKTYNASAASLRKYVHASIKTWSGFWKHVSKEVGETSSLYMVHMQLPVLNI